MNVGTCVSAWGDPPHYAAIRKSTLKITGKAWFTIRRTATRRGAARRDAPRRAARRAPRPCSQCLS